MNAPMRDFPLDRVVRQDAERICVERFVAFGDPIFDEHFPERAVLPGSFIIATAVAAAQKLHDDEQPYRVELDRVVFLRPVEPGDLLLMLVWKTPAKEADAGRSTFRFTATARHDSRPFAEGLITLTFGEAA